MRDRTYVYVDRNSKQRASRRRRRAVFMTGCAFLIAFALFCSWKALAPVWEQESDEVLAASGTVANLISESLQNEADFLPEQIEEEVKASEDAKNPTVTNDVRDWKLVLVNPWNKMEEGYVPGLTQLINGYAIDSRCYSDLQEMINACKADGLSPYICSAYRTHQQQIQLYNNKVNYFLGRGYSMADARAEAGTVVAVPGTSEHQLGLALDIVDSNNHSLTSAQENTAVQKWLMNNSWKYGFILRYPSGKSDITGIIYEPWHYRYVGSEAAQYIYENGICLEEYLNLL